MDNQVAGGPDWVDTDRFDVEGTSPGTRDSQGYTLPAAVPLMLRQLLADRFSLKAHFETRDRPVFALVLANRDGTLGPGFRRRTVDCIPAKVLPAPKKDDRTCHSQGSPTGFISASGIAMPLLVNVLSQSIPEIDRMVVDRTGLAGMFDIELRWTPDIAITAQSAGKLEHPSIFVALQEQLGLKLERTTAPIEVLVIDSVERPTPN